MSNSSSGSASQTTTQSESPKRRGIASSSQHIPLSSSASSATGETIQAIISSLSSSCESKVYNSLVQLRTKYTREKTNVQIFHNCGGSDALLTLVSKTINDASTCISTSNTNVIGNDVEVGGTVGTSVVQESLNGSRVPRRKRETGLVAVSPTCKNPILVKATANRQPCPQCLQSRLGEGLSIAEGLPNEECSHGTREMMMLSRPQRKLLDLCLSILGNCVLLDERIRDLLVKRDAIHILAKLLISCDTDSICNRASRTLANIALDKRTIHLVVKEEHFITTIIKVLTESENKDCQQSYVRLLRLIGAVDCGREAIIKAEGLRPIAEKLKLDHEPLVTASFRAVQDLTARLSDSCVGQMIEADCTSFLVESLSSTNKTFSEFALSILLSLALHKDFRPAFGAAAGIKSFISLAESESKTQQITLKVINVLCLCCGESVNRIKMRELGGIILLMKCIRDASMSALHNRILSSFVCFLYDEASFSLMLENSLMDILIEQLSKCSDVKTVDLVAMANDVINQEIHKEEDFKCEDLLGNEPSGLFCEKFVDLEDAPQDAVEMTEYGNEKDEVSFEAADGLGTIATAVTEESTAPVKNEAVEDGSKTSLATECVKYSIDSPSYEHTEWDYTQYSKGVKCKTSFSADPSGGWSPIGSDWSGYHSDSSSHYSSKFSPTYSSPRSSYSPLSNSSFVSPSVSPFYGPTYSPPSSPDYQSSESNHAAPPGPMAATSGLNHGREKARVVQHLSFSLEHTCESYSQPSLDVLSASTAKITQTDQILQPIQSVPETIPHVSLPIGSGLMTNVVESNVERKPVVLTDVQVTENESTPMLSSSKSDQIQSTIAGTLGSALVGSLGKCTSESEQEAVVKVKTSSSDGQLTASSTKSKDGSDLKRPNVRKKRSVSDPLSVLDGSDVSSGSCRDDLVSSENATVINILTLISRISHMDDPSVYLLNTKCMDLLLSYIVLCHNPPAKAWRILIRLARNRNCFERLLEKNVPLKVSILLGQTRDGVVKFLIAAAKTESRGSLLQSSDQLQKETLLCEREDNQLVTMKELGSPSHVAAAVGAARDAEARKQMQTLSEEFIQALMLVVESRYGQEVILHRVRNGTDKERRMWAMNALYLCRSHFLQSRMLLKGGALELVFDELVSGQKTLLMFAVHCLAVLGSLLRERALDSKSKFGIVDTKRMSADKIDDGSNNAGTDSIEKMHPSKRRRVVMGRCCFETSDMDLDVTFSFDNHSHVSTNRRKLCSKSTVFAAMLEGYYSESSKCTVSISEVQPEAFVAMLHFLNGCDRQPHCPSLHCSDLSKNLEVLRLADKYLLSDLKQFAVNKLKGLISQTTVCQITEYATLLKCNTLLNQCFYFIMFSHFPIALRMKLIDSLVQGDHRLETMLELKLLICKIIQD
ncbi:uncharacterized protein LOC135483326 [Lineus longissimus]|uniref:uncharacterized protein LOC135483326 n=1 Tax=Lineus longissimus TaxID=88925 RepID=UPI00315D5A34